MNSAKESLVNSAQDDGLLITVTRRNIWMNTLDALKGSTEPELSNGLCIVFATEEGVDNDRLTHEFFAQLKIKIELAP